VLFRISKIQTFASNSQHDRWWGNNYFSCSEYQRYKLLRAIHNTSYKDGWTFPVVQNIKDTNFCEQFTTIPEIRVGLRKLFRISKIQTFASNSQHYVYFVASYQSCSEYQRYKLLRAIHNNWRSFRLVGFVVQNIKDTNFCEQFTTFSFSISLVKSLFRISKIQTFASNSQLQKDRSISLFVVQNIKDTNFCEQFTTTCSRLQMIACCSEYQRYKLLRAIHNLWLLFS